MTPRMHKLETNEQLDIVVRELISWMYNRGLTLNDSIRVLHHTIGMAILQMTLLEKKPGDDKKNLYNLAFLLFGVDAREYEFEPVDKPKGKPQ